MPSYHAELIGHTKGLFPVPTATKLRVVVVDKFLQPCRLTIPVTIWPSNQTLLKWWLIAYLGIIGVRWQNMAAHRETLGGILSTRK